MENREHNRKNGRILAGLFLLAAGILLFLDKAGYYLMPTWLFTWPTMLIALGIFIGLKHEFKGGGWIVLIVIGAIFLVDFSQGFYIRKYLWPAVVILIGLAMIFRPSKKRYFREGSWQRRWREDRESFYHQPQPEPSKTIPTANAEPTGAGTSQEDYVDSVAVFGGIKKVFLTKNFKGGEAVSVFGGNEIDLSRADLNGIVTLELTQVLGGTKLIVPRHWNVISEVAAFLGGIDDKRNIDPASVDPNKTLLLKGTAVLGGIEIKNY